MRDHFLFRQFFNGLALAGAWAEWGVACWLLAPLRLTVPAEVHLVAPLLLAVVNRLAARAFEREPVYGPLTGVAGRVILAGAFGGITCAVALGVAAGAWTGMRFVIGGFQAEAGMVAAGAREGFFGGGFRALGSFAIGSAAVAVVYGYLHGHRRLVVTRLELPVAGLPPALVGLRLVQVSDLHLGPLADRAALQDALSRVAALQPDVICLTGDIVDSPITDLASWMPELCVLAAPHGAFAILGNHDFRAGGERVSAALARWTGLRVLRDEVATVTIGDARLHLIGLDDRAEPQARDILHRLLATVPAGEPVVLLAHHPELFPAAAAAGVPLTLAGHTHGGQVTVPGLPWINPARLLMTVYDSGLHERDGAILHVNRGLGVSGQRVRISAPREITVVTLVAAEAVRAA